MSNCEYLSAFLRKMGVEELREVYAKAAEFYVGRYGRLQQFPEEWLRHPSLLSTSFKRLASLIEALDILPEQHFLLWLAKLYFVLPLPPGWKAQRLSMTAFEYVTQDQVSPFHPSIAYALLLKHEFAADSTQLKSLKKQAQGNAKSNVHFFSDEREVPTVSQYVLFKEYTNMPAKERNRRLNSKSSSQTQPFFLAEGSLRVKNDARRDKLRKTLPLLSWIGDKQQSPQAENARPNPSRKAFTAKVSLPAREEQGPRAKQVFGLTERKKSSHLPQSRPDQNTDAQFSLAGRMDSVNKLQKVFLDENVYITRKKLWNGLYVGANMQFAKNARIHLPGDNLFSLK